MIQYYGLMVWFQEIRLVKSFVIEQKKSSQVYRFLNTWDDGSFSLHSNSIHQLYLNNSNKLYLLNTDTMIKDTMAIILMRISSDGPTVSLRGSPTVSPITVDA